LSSNGALYNGAAHRLNAGKYEHASLANSGGREKAHDAAAPCWPEDRPAPAAPRLIGRAGTALAPVTRLRYIGLAPNGSAD
jgi:hypothetical protein